MSASAICPHPEFDFDVGIDAFENTDLRVITLRAKCSHCQQPVAFGAHHDKPNMGPRASEDRKTAYIPVLCDDPGPANAYVAGMLG